jgi:hypothetical protein
LDPALEKLTNDQLADEWKNVEGIILHVGELAYAWLDSMTEELESLIRKVK